MKLPCIYQKVGREIYIPIEKVGTGESVIRVILAENKK
jgi:hypothetical protein